MDVPPQMKVLQMMMGHWVAQIVGTIAQLNIADHLAGGPKTSDQLAKELEADPDAVFRILRAAAGVGFFERNGKTFALNALSDCLRTDSPAGLKDLLAAELAPGHWLPWGRLPDAVRTGKPQATAALGMDAWAYYAKHPAEGASFARGMGNLSKMVAMDVAAVYDFKPFAKIVDVGGSQGALIAAALHQAPHSHGVIFDLPEVIAAGAETIKSYGLGDRLTTQGGDFFQEVTAGADAYLLKSILHDWDDEKCLAILTTIERAAKPGSKLLVFEMILNDSPMGTPVSLMDVNMLVMLGGRERTAEELGALFSKAGFRLEKVIPTHGLFVIVEGVKT